MTTFARFSKNNQWETLKCAGNVQHHITNPRIVVQIARYVVIRSGTTLKHPVDCRYKKLSAPTTDTQQLALKDFQKPYPILNMEY